MWHRRQQAIAKFRKAIRNPRWHPSQDGSAMGAQKPKGMHWKTFERLALEVDAVEKETLDQVKQKLNKLCGSEQCRII